MRFPFAMPRLPILLAVLLAMVCPSAAVAGEPGEFGSISEHHAGLDPFPKWKEVLDRYLNERKAYRPDCRESELDRCHFNRWFDFINGLKEKPAGEQLKAVNEYINKHPYVLDPVNWGVKDYWESPGEFFAKNGDCEDFAIAKYMTLRALGWKPESLRIVILQDLNLNVPHAVLSVSAGGKFYVLDNQIAMVVEDSRIKHYRPIYAVNENDWWRLKAQ